MFLAVFTSAMIGIIALTTYLMKYIYPSSIKKKLVWGIIILDVITMFALPAFLGLYKDNPYASYIIRLIAIIFMTQLTFNAWCLLYLLARKIGKILQKTDTDNVDQERRQMIKAAVGIPALSIATSLYSSFGEYYNTVVNYTSIYVDDLPKNLQGVTIAQLSDIHLGPFMDLERLRELLEKVVLQKPDILVITGDIFDDEKLNAQAVAVVNEHVIHFPKGIFFCYGNHEHFRGIKAINEALKGTSINVLRNRNAVIDFNGDKLYVIGVDYPMNKDKFAELQEKFIEKAMTDVPSNGVKLLLSHHPDFFDSAITRGINLTLSGHTHGGQIGLWGVPIVPPVFKYMRGLYQEGESYCYVHCGNGSWFPYRLGCPPEIAIFTLEGK